MSTGQKTQTTFIQESQSTAEQEASHSALFYLFQEVSRLASPVKTSFLDTNSPSKWLNETPRQDNFIVKKEEDNARLFQTFNSSCQHSLSHKFPYNLVNKAKEESHTSNLTTLVEPHHECNSPWKVLSLINLQCEKLMYRRDVEESDSSSILSTRKLGHLTVKSSTAAADVTEWGVRSDGVGAEYTPRPSLLKKQEITVSLSHVEDMRGVFSGGATNYKLKSCVKDARVDFSAQPQSIEKTETGISELVEENATASFQPQHGDKREVKFSVSRLEWNQKCKKDCFLMEEDFLKVPLCENAVSQAHISNGSLNTQLTFDSNEDTSVALSKSALTVDHNANIVLPTEPPSDTQLPSPGDIQPCSQLSSASLFFRATGESLSLPKKDNKITGSKPECVNVSIEEKSFPVEQLKSSSYNVPSAALQLELRPVQSEEICAPSSQQWRNKTPRKQPHPSRSVDIQDPDFQGVTFRMGTELDVSREQSRLLITSKYSKELCRSRKPRLRTRTSQKSLKTSSSDEDSDPTNTVSKDKVCASCCTRKTPMWRDAEDGTPLCNACGIRYKKYRVRCVNCWHIPRKEGNSNSCCLKCGNLVRLTSAQRKHTA